MNILTSNRVDYIIALNKIIPIKVITFTYPNKLVEQCKFSTIKLIINTNNVQGKKFPELWQVKTNNKVHAKIAIGLNGMILGSWNFSNFDLHEACHVITNKKIIKKYEEFFDKLWGEQ